MRRYLRKLNSFYNCHKYRNSELKNWQKYLKNKSMQKNYYMIVYLKYDSGCKYIWAYIICGCGYSYKPSIKMLNSSYPKPFVFNIHDKFSF